MEILTKIGNFIRKERAYIIIAYLIIPFIFFGRLFFQNTDERIFIGSDFLHYFTGFQYYIDRLSDFSFPFWDPYVYQGLPFLARADLALLYPINFLWVLIGALLELDTYALYIWYEAYAIFHLSLAGIFCYYFARDLKISKIGSFLTGLVFMFSGTILMMVNTIPLVASLVWLPLILLLYRRSLYSNKNREFFYLLLMTIFLAVSYFAGYIQISLFYTGIFIVLFYVYWVITEKEYSIIEKLRKLLYLSAVYFVSVLIYAVQLIPTLNLLSHSNRDSVSFVTTVFYGAVKPFEVINLILPNIFRYFDGTNIINIAPAYLYFGVLPLILFLVAIVYSKKKITIFFSATFFIFLIASFGGSTSLYEFMALYIPKLDMFRNVNKILYLATFSFSVLAGIGFDIIARKYIEDGREKSLKLRNLFVYFLSISFSSIIITYFHIYLKYNKAVSPGFNDALLDNVLNSFFVFMLFSLASIILVSYLRGAKKFWVIGIIICLFVIIDLSNFNKFSLPNTSNINPSFYLSKKKVDYFDDMEKDKDYFRVKFVNGIYGAHYAPEVFNIYNSDGYSSFVLKNVSNNLLKINSLDKSSDEFAKKIGELSVKYVVSGLEIVNESLELVDEYVVDYTNEDHFFKYGGDTVGVINATRGDRFYLYENKLYETIVKTKANYEIKEVSPEKVVMAIHANEKRKVIVRMYDYPGWSVFVNNERKKHEVTDSGFIEFEVPKDESLVEVRYKENNFLLGLFITAITFIIVLFFLIKYRKSNDKI